MDRDVNPTQHIASRPMITPRRIRCRLSHGRNLDTIQEVTEPGEPLAADAIDKCASKLTSLRIEDAPKPIAPTVTPAPASNPIRLYVGYNRVTRPPFLYGTDVVSTQNCFEVAL